MERVLKTLEQNLFYIVIAIFLTLSAVHLFTGYTDSGDFHRSTDFLFERTTQAQQKQPPFIFRSYEGWQDTWALHKDGMEWSAIKTYSAYKLYLLLQTKISSLLSGDSTHYSVVLGSLLSRMLLLGTLVAQLLYFRRQLPLGIFWITAFFLMLISLDVAWMAYLNSFYEEQMAIILFPLMGLLLCCYQEKSRVLLGLFLLLCATYLGATKTAFFYFPILMAFFIYPIFKGKWARTRFFILLMLCQCIAFLPVHFGIFKNQNAYASVYVGPLLVLNKNELNEVKFIGKKPVLQDCVGVTAWSNDDGWNNKGINCVKNAKASYGDVARLIWKTPSIAPRMVTRLFKQGQNITMPVLAKNMKGAPNFSTLLVLNGVSGFFAAGYNVIALILLVICSILLLFVKALNSSAKIFLKTSIFFSAFGFSQYIAVLGDGFNDITKHLMAGNYALALAFPFMLAGLLVLFRGYQKSLCHKRFQNPEKCVTISPINNNT